MDNKKWFRSLLWRRALICLVLLLQIGLLVYLTLRGDQSSRTVSAVLRLVSFLVCLSIMSKREKDAFKLSWVFLILMFPVFGGLFYLLLTVWNRPKRDRQRAETISRETKPLYLLLASHVGRTLPTVTKELILLIQNALADVLELPKSKEQCK